VPVHVVAAGKLDFQQTASMGWQTNWKTMDTAYFPNRVALKTEVFDAARAGDALAAREVDEMTDILGMALASIASTTDPEMFMVG
ncbi:hypothetical protein R2O95_14155, partial [Faecalibacterium duncaniae]|nr:hypothetical protein [Faecalibacterium duncaniae]